MRPALRVKDFRRLSAAFALSRAGDQIFSIALIVYVLERTGSATWVAALMVVRLLPIVVVGPVAGVVADRFPRRRLMVATDLVRLVLMVGLVILVAGDAPLVVIIGVTVVAGVAGTPYLPSFTASLPRVVDERNLAGANAVVSVLDYLATIVGPALGAVVAATWGLEAALVVNAASFALSALLLMTVRGQVDARLAGEDADVTHDGADGAEGAESAAAAWQGMGHELADGVRAVTSDPVLRVMTAAIVLSTLAFGFELVYMVFVSRDLLGTGASGVGWLDAAVGVGGVVGALFVSRLADTRRPRSVLAWVSLLSILPMAALAWVSSPAVAYGLLLVEGAAGVALDVVVITTMQRSVRDELLARADALISSVAVAATMVGGLLAPVLLAAVGLRASLVIAAVVPVLVLVVLVARLRPVVESAADVQRRDEVLALLETIGPLRDLAPTEREQLALAARPRTVPAGETIVRQGDEPTLVLLLATGHCDVLQAHPPQGAHLIATVQGPDLVGEIGVVGRRPRTATVVATTDCTGYDVPAETFRDVLSIGNAELPTLRSAIGSRLSRSLAS